MPDGLELDRLYQIRRMARAFHNLTHQGRPPYLVSRLFKVLGLERRDIDDPQMPCDALLMGRQVYLSTNQLHVRKRWSGAHEAAHYILHPKIQATHREGLLSDPILERECDIFAREFLCPGWQIRQCAACTPAGKRLLHLSQVFLVSSESMRIRFRELSIEL